MEKRIGNFQLKQQIGGKGFFASVSLTVNLSDHEGSLQITFDESVDPQWQEAASVGIRTAWSCIPTKARMSRTATFIVNAITSQPSETTEIVVLYVSARAVLSLFDVVPKNTPAFVPEFGVFVFGK